jgi:hypothetical protein
MANEKISQMTSLTAAEVAADDLLLITDTSARESKRITTADFLTYVETTGSFNALTAVTSVSTSYIQGGRVDGSVSSASFSTRTYTASLAIKAITSDTASLASTASFVSGISQIATSSFLLYSGVPNGTASFALTASRVSTAQTSSFLIFTGVPNGTSSFSLTSSVSLFALSASVVAGTNFTSSFATSASFSNRGVSCSYALNGIVSYTSVLGTTVQVGTGGTISRPFPIFGLEARVIPTSVNSNFLIILSTSVANGTAGGVASVALWKSSSFSTGSLNADFANLSLSDGDLVSMTTTYIDKPQYDPGTPLTYSAQIFNPLGASWYVNRDRSNLRTATSSISVIEFII